MARILSLHIFSVPFQLILPTDLVLGTRWKKLLYIAQTIPPSQTNNFRLSIDNAVAPYSVDYFSIVCCFRCVTV